MSPAHAALWAALRARAGTEAQVAIAWRNLLGGPQTHPARLTPAQAAAVRAGLEAQAGVPYWGLKTVELSGKGSDPNA